MKKFTSVSIAILSIFAVSSANAADVFGSGSTKDGPIVSSGGGAVNWTGFYIGGQVGYGNANHSLSVEEYTDNTICIAEQGCVPNDGGYYPEPVWLNGEVIAPGQVFPLGGIDGINSNGLVGGARVGFDYAPNRFLIGLFAEYNFAGYKSEIHVNDYDGDVIEGKTTLGLEKQDEWTIGARAGLLVNPRTLVYALVGYTQTEYNVTGNAFDNMGPLPEGASFKRGASFDGISVGGGVEFAVTSNIFLGLEYQHTFYGDEAILDAHQKVVNPGVAEGGFGGRIVDSLDEDKVLATLKVKLNSGLPGISD